MFLGGVQSVIPANFNKTESSLQLIWHARVSICRRKMYSKEKKKKKIPPGCECVKNPFTSWRPTKKIVSASQSEARAALWRARLQPRGLWVDNLLSSPATCCPPAAYPQLSSRYSQQTRPGNPGLLLPSWPKDSAPQGVAHWHVPAYPGQKKGERCSPTPLCIFEKAASIPFSSQQSTSQLLPFEYKGPSERKRHLAHAFQRKSLQQIFVWKCSKMRFNTLKAKRWH